MPKRVHWEVTSKSGHLFVRRDTRDEAIEQMDPSRVGRVVKVTRYSARESAARRRVLMGLKETTDAAGCIFCCISDWHTGKHEDDCPLGNLLMIESEAKK